MRKKIIVLIIAVLPVLFTGIFADVTQGIAAYPVPYNPGRGVMKISDLSGALTGIQSVEVIIFDINGDRVFSRNFAGFTNVVWNGRNDSGVKVSPGMYIVKVTVEDANGYVGKRLIRILVNY